MHELLIATHNQGKLREYRDLLPNWHILSLRDVGLGGFEVREMASTFHENALLKARGYGRASGLLTLADDSGLVVDALDGAPGVHSARYGGIGLDDGGRRRYLLEQLRGVPLEQRQARFVCVIILYDPAHDAWAQAEGVCEGLILTEERDEGQGFGYDPLFQPDGYALSFGQLPTEIKHAISHRGRAAAQIPALLQQLGF